MMLSIVLFGAAAAFFVHRAQTNDRGLIINGVIELETGGATIFFWVFAALSALFVLAGAAACASRLSGKRFIELDDDAITVPGRWRGAPKRVAYGTIQSLQMVKVQSQRFLRIEHQAGRLEIAAIMLESNAVLDEIAAELQTRTKPR